MLEWRLCRSRWPAASLLSLPKPPHRQPRDRRAPQVLEHRAREIAHLDQRHVGQLIVRAHRVLARVAGAGGNVRDAVRAGDVDAWWIDAI